MADLPKTIGKYEIRRALGKGAMGMVYEGFDPVIERKVAIKTILPDYLEDSDMQEAVTRFKREAQAGGRLQHPGIVAVYEFGTDTGMAFMVTEYVDGEELKRVLGSGRSFEIIEVFEIMKQLLTALDYSHKQGVVHRDIKPANLMIILPGPKVKIMDFGIARLESSSLTQVGTVVGTPTHMSPEQLMGIPADGRADLWASGVILYELLTGVSPFLAETPAAVMHNVLQTQPVAPSALKPGVPPGFDGVCARALAKKADERFQNAREFQAAMLMALQGKAVTATMTLRTQTAMRPPEQVPVLAIDPEVLAQIEGSLSRHLGPLARVLIRKTQGETTDFDTFFHLLADQIPDEEEQKAFLKKVAALKPKARPAPQGTKPAPKPEAPPPKPAQKAAFTPDDLATAERRLASYVGPLAKLLIKDAASQTSDLKELYRALAAHIDSDDERRDFLASLPPMTTIVVVRKGGSAVIAADSLTTFGTTRLAPAYDRSPHKVVRYRESFIGVAGSAAHQLVLENILERNPNLDFAGRAAIYETFRKLHPVLKDEAFLNPKEEEDDPYESSQMTVMVANPCGIFAVYSMREVFEFDRFWAIGSGRDFALGAMYSVYGRAKGAAAVAEAGVIAGAEFDTGTALPVDLHEVELRV